jgi:DNA-binding CsgD family transcriptional regulator
MPVADVDDAEISPSGEPAESLTEPVSDGLVERIVADARATHVEPHPFIGLAERADVIIDLEIDNARYILLRTAPQQQAPPALSPRELEIARMVTKGLPNKSIATVLQISTWTVSSHLRRVFTKLGVNSRAEMVGRLLEAGCLPASSMFDLDGTLP